MRAGASVPVAETEDTAARRAVVGHLHNLEYDAARQELEAWLHREPSNLGARNYLATVILYKEMFRLGILEKHFYGDSSAMFRSGTVSPTAGFRKELFAALDKAQSLAEARLKQNPSDEEALYWAAQTHSTRAIFDYAMEKASRAALHEATAARETDELVLRVNPHNVDALLVLGMNDYIVGSLPWYAKVVASLAGFHGNRARGLEEVRRVSEHGDVAREDAKFMLAILYRREKMYPEARAVLEGLAQSYPQNFLLEQERGKLYESEGDIRSAAKVYDAMAAKVQAHDPAYAAAPTARILFEAGERHRWLGDTRQALAHYEAAAEAPSPDDVVYAYRAELAAANLEMLLNRAEDARRRYERVARAAPNTDEGQAASRALKAFSKTHGARPAGD